jgi:hypothetical protein
MPRGDRQETEAPGCWPTEQVADARPGQAGAGAGPVGAGRPVRLRRLGTDAGMTTAEYAVGTVAACGFAGVLFKLLTSGTVVGLLTGIVTRALSTVG